MRVETALEVVSKSIDDAKLGLPENVFCFISSITPMVNVDLLIKNDAGEILLARRKDKFAGMTWHIPGGIVRYKESRKHRIEQVAINEIGEQVYIDDMPIAVNEIFANHQERGHFISFLYSCKLKKDIEVVEKEIYEPGELKWFSKCPEDFIECQKDIYKKYFIN